MNRTQPATLVFGAKIKNQEGIKVGQVKDLIVDLRSGKVIYAVISFSNENDKEARYFPIPVTAIKEGGDKEGLRLDIKNEKLKDAPAFKDHQWPKEYDEEFVQTIYCHYGYDLPGHVTEST